MHYIYIKYISVMLIIIAPFFGLFLHYADKLNLQIYANTIFKLNNPVRFEGYHLRATGSKLQRRKLST